jgi:hypothetical protein
VHSGLCSENVVCAVRFDFDHGFKEAVFGGAVFDVLF